jgi:hypothetical protein
MPQTQGSPTVAPPPTDQPVGQPSLDTGGAPGDGGQMDHFRAIISRLSGGGTPAINKALEQHHAKIEAEAQGYAESAKRYYGLAAKARHGGKDPLTGNPATPEQIEQWQAQGDAMWQNYTKIAGKSKEAKPIIQQVGGLIRHITGHPGAAGGQTPSQGGSPQGGQPMSAGGAPTQQGSKTVPPPPGANPLQASAEGSTMNALSKEQDEFRVAGGKKSAEESGNIEGIRDGLSKAGFTPDQIRAVIQSKIGGAGMRAASKMHPILISDPSDPTKQIPALQSTSPNENGQYPVFNAAGEVVDNPSRLLPSMLPTVTGTSSTYHPETGTTSTTHTSQKVAPSGSSPSKPARGSTVSSPPGSSPKGGRIATMAHSWATSGIEPSAKDKPYVEKYMADHDMQPVQKPTATERKLQDDLKKVEPMVDRLQSFLEDNKLTEAGSGGLFSPSSWGEKAKVQKAWEEYAHGIPPKDKQLGQLIKYAAAIKIMGAAPWMSIGRGRYLFSEVVKHLPSETDTPAQLYEKVNFYRDILEDAKASLPSGLTGGGNGAPANPYR